MIKLVREVVLARLVCYARTRQLPKTKGNKITVDSTFVVHLFIRGLQNRDEADIVKKRYHDVIELSVDDHGKMKTVKTGTDQNESGTGSVNAFANFLRRCQLGLQLPRKD